MESFKQVIESMRWVVNNYENEPADIVKSKIRDIILFIHGEVDGSYYLVSFDEFFRVKELFFSSPFNIDGSIKTDYLETIKKWQPIKK